MSPFTVLFWKEYRQQRSLAAAMILLSVTIQIVAYASTVLQNQGVPVHGTPAFYMIALFMTALYAASAAAISWSAEYDEGTFSRLRSLPVRGRTVLLGKIAWLLASTGFVATTTWAFSLPWTLCGILSDLDRPEWVLGLCGVGAIEGLAWGIFWSSRCRSQLNALLLTYISASLSAWFCAVFLTAHVGDDVYVTYANAAPMRLVIASLVGAIGLWNAALWLRRPEPAPKVVPPSEDEELIDELQKAGIASVTPAVLAKVRAQQLERQHPVQSFTALLWLGWRQSRTLLCAWLALSFCFAVVETFCLFTGVWFDHYGIPATGFGPLRILLCGAMLLGLIVLGGSIFHQDQRGGMYRMLGHRGVSPVKLWWSRFLLFGSAYLVPLLLIAGALLIFGLHAWNGLHVRGWLPTAQYDTILGFSQSYRNIRPVLIPMVSFCVFMFFTPLCTGMLCSLCLRSGILAVAATGFLSLLLIFWAGLLFSLFSFNPLWTTAPILLALLAASYFRAPDWLRERHDWRSWKRPGLLLVLVPLLILIAIPFVRVYSIPVLDFGFPVDRTLLNTPLAYTHDEEREYREWMVKAFALRDYQSDWLRQEDKEGRLSENGRKIRIRSMSPEQLKREIAEQEKLFTTWPGEEEVWNRIYTTEYREIKFGRSLDRHSPRQQAINWYRWLPWEKVRMLRRLDAEYQVRLLAHISTPINIQVAERYGDTWFRNRREEGEGYYYELLQQAGIDPDKVERSSRKIRHPDIYDDQPGTLDQLGAAFSLLDRSRGGQIRQREIGFRCYLLATAIRCYWIGHGKLPENLEMLFGEKGYLKPFPESRLDTQKSLPFWYVEYDRGTSSRNDSRVFHMQNRRSIRYLPDGTQETVPCLSPLYGNRYDFWFALPPDDGKEYVRCQRLTH